MTKHILERALVGGLLAASLACAILQKWSPAGYLLFLAAFIDFDNWAGGGRQ